MGEGVLGLEEAVGGAQVRFSTEALLAFWKTSFFVGRGHPVNFRMFSSISDLYLLWAIISNLLVVTIKIKLIKTTCL